jgi:hypothetical protein
MAGEAREYEKYVRDITQALLNAQGLETIKVEHDVLVKGLSREHQVDVYWEYRLGGVLHRVVINCKRYKNTVEVTDVETLAGVLHDLPGARGLIVTTIGYQKGAMDYAKVHQIGLKVIRPPQDADWEGRIREIVTEVRLQTPVLLGCFIEVNEAWFKVSGLGNVEDMGGVDPAATTFVRDLSNGSLTNIADLWNRVIRENPSEPEQPIEAWARFENAMLERDGKPSLRVDGIRFRWVLKVSAPITIRSKNDPQAIVRDALTGTLLFVEPSGLVTGDVAEELGRE